MKKNLTTAHKTMKQKYMTAAEAAILAQRPDLQGRFSNLHIWESLDYFYTCNGMNAAAAARRILDQYPPAGNTVAESFPSVFKTTPAPASDPEPKPTAKTYTYYQDPGHGWIKVSKAELKALGISEQITRYSYEHKDFAYLEEDKDAGTFIQAYTAKHGTRPALEEVYQERTPIRNYDHYNTAATVALITRAAYTITHETSEPEAGNATQPQQPRLF